MSQQLQLIDTQAEGRAMTPMQMIERALDNGATVETLEKLMALQERWEANQARKAFDSAMSALRQEMPEIMKEREVDFTSTKGRTNYRYEDLSLVTRALSPVMAKHGLSFRWRTTQQDSAVSVTCVISHRDGHFEETTLSAAQDHSGNKNSIQAIGSTVTYLQRYTLKAAVGVAAAPDADGAAPSQAEAEYDETEWLDRIEKMQPGEARKVNEAIKADRAKIPDRKFKLIVGAYNARLARLKEMDNAAAE